MPDDAPQAQEPGAPDGHDPGGVKAATASLAVDDTSDATHRPGSHAQGNGEDTSAPVGIDQFAELARKAEDDARSRYATALRRLPACLEPYRDKRVWLLWKYLYRPNSKPDKPPIDWRDGRPHDAYDTSIWLTYDEAVAKMRAARAGGVGIVSIAAPDLVFIDLDRCREPDTGLTSNSIAGELLDATAHTYAEITPSQAGYRIIGTAADLDEVSKNGTLGDTLGIEVYKNTRRWLTVTGDRLLEDSVIAEHADALADLTQLITRILARIKPRKTYVAPDGDDKVRATTRQHVAGILSGNSYHHSLVAIAAQLIADGVPQARVVNFLLGMMEGVEKSAADHARWSARYRAIPSIVDSAYKKFAEVAAHRRTLTSEIGKLFHAQAPLAEIKAYAAARAAQLGLPITFAEQGVQNILAKEVAKLSDPDRRPPLAAGRTER